MLNHDENLNPEILDRLVDGELSNQEYEQTLRQLDTTPDGWRQCALSFLEQQALQVELRQLLKGDPILNSAGSGDSEWQEAELSEELHFTPASRDWDRWFGKPWIRWTSVVAVGLFAFLTALTFRSNDSKTPGIAATPSIQRPGNTVSPSAVPSLVADTTMRSAGDRASISFQGSTQTFQVPVQQIAFSQGRPSLAPNHIPAQIESLSSEMGRRSRVERVVITLRTSSGEIVFLPFDRIILADDFR